MISKISIVWLNDHSPTDSYPKSIDAITYHIFKLSAKDVNLGLDILLCLR